MDRKGFLRRTCIAGACCCGFGAVTLKTAKESLPEQNAKSQLGQDWLTSLLGNLDRNLDQMDLRKIIKMSATVHYQHLKMDEVLSGYQDYSLRSLSIKGGSGQETIRLRRLFFNFS